jgi:hypothetical protein
MGQWSLTKILIAIGIVIIGVTVVVLSTTLILLHPSNIPIVITGAVPALVTTSNLTNCTVIYLTYKKEYYGTNSTFVVFDTQSGASLTIGDTAVPIHQLFVSQNNTLYGIGRGPQYPYGNGFGLYIVDPITASLTMLCETFVQYNKYHGLPRVAIDSSGTFWMQGNAPEMLYILDPNTCSATNASSGVFPAFTYGGIYNDTFYSGKTPEDLLYKQSLSPPYTVSLVGSIGIPVIYGLTSQLFPFCPAPGDVRLQMGWQYTEDFVNFTSIDIDTGSPIPGTQFTVPLTNSQYSAWAFSSSCWCF